jgi:hypothetical protein
MRRGLRWALLATIVTAALPDVSGATNCGSRSFFGRLSRVTVLALTSDQRLIRFKECTPGKVREIGTLSGLGGPDTALIGIDFRVQDGKLYGVGNGGGVYTIDPLTAQAALVSQLTETLSGTVFGVDFNPAADRLRIVSDTGQNLRHNVNAGGTTTADMALKNGDVVATGIAGAAYTNNDLDASTATTLFDIDTAMDQLSVQSPPNNGNLVATGKLTVDAAGDVGFDVYTALSNGVAVGNWGFAALSVGGTTSFYRVNLLTGKAISIGSFGVPVVDVAVPFAQ